MLIASGAVAVARFVRERLLGAPALIILCYHRITDTPFTVSARCVSPSAFAEQLAHFGRRYDIWPLTHVASYLRGKRTLRRDTLVLTVDDGYLDGFIEAAPVLEAQGVTATFFVSAGPSLDGRPYWMDQLGEALGRLQEIAVDKAPPVIGHLLTEYTAAGATGRTDLARQLVATLKEMEESDREEVLRSLGRHDGWAGPPAMGRRELRDLASRGHEIAAHGCSHAMLSALAEVRCREETVGCIALFRQAGFDVRSFAYPFGGAREIGAMAPGAVAEGGITLAVTTEGRAVRLSDDPLRLPRMVVSTQSLDLIAVRLEKLAWRATLW